MISIQNLTKIYKSKNKFDCVALDNLSFNLPDKGMVFILGKSGSGKSTLLNLIGGLDSFDSGEICVDGAKLSQFCQKDYYDYRGNYVGFVFQDYHLLDELTIEQNVALNLDISAIEHSDKIALALQKVDMQEYASRYPQELSGGQKQRVAIARTIAKEPSIVLCDEPTGNLDNKTSKQILDLLKNISQQKLVLIVSHNVNDAQKYADRIIELADGKLFSDQTRIDGYKNEFCIENETLLLPHNDNLDESQIDAMVKGIKQGKITKVVQNNDGFEQTQQLTQQTGRKYKGTKTKMSAKNLFKLSRIFAKRKRKSFVLTAIVATLIISCFAVFQSFLAFDSNKALAQTLVQSNPDAIVYQKGQQISDTDQIDTEFLLPVSDKEANDFANAGYTGKIFKLYNNTLIVTPDGKDIINRMMNLDVTKNIESFYPQETYGVLQCDKDFLTKKFGVNGHLQVLAGNLAQPNKGVIITDYVADGIIFSQPQKYADYQSLIGKYTYTTGSKYGVIDCVIDTGYKQKYSDIKEQMQEMMQNSSNYAKDMAELAGKPEFAKFAEDVRLYLGISYTFSNDFIADIGQSLDFFEWAYAPKIVFEHGDSSATLQYPYSQWITHENKHASIALQPGEIALNYATFNSFAGTSYTPFNLDTFVPCQVKMSLYNHDGSFNCTNTYTVAKLVKNNYIYMDAQDMLVLRPHTTHAYALYFDDATQADVIFDVAMKNHFALNSIDGKNASNLSKIIITFNDLFKMFELFLLAICVLYLAVFGANVIRKNRYQIGVIKALGGKTNHVARIFVTQLLVVGLLIFILSGMGIFTATNLANLLLITSVREHLGVNIYNLQVIEFIPHLALIDLVIVLVLTVLSCLAPLVAIHKIKPINIIKAKE